MLYPHGMINLAVSLTIILVKGLGDVSKFFYKNPVLILLPVIVTAGVVAGVQNGFSIGEIDNRLKDVYGVTYQGVIANWESIGKIENGSTENSTLAQLKKGSTIAVGSTRSLIESERFQGLWNGDSSPFKQHAITAKETALNEAGETVEYLKSQCYLQVVSESYKSFSLGQESDNNCFLIVNLESIDEDVEKQELQNSNQTMTLWDR